MASVSFQNASRTYPKSSRPAVAGLSLDIADGEFLALIGPSGCGKTTTLRMLAGLETVDEGRILIGDRDVTGVEPRERNVAIVFQEYSLYPHMSVGDNIAFPLKLAGMPKAEIKQRVQRVAGLLDLTPQLRRRPRALSGGQKQRVAMGRAIVREPTAFLLDEPLSNIDETLRVEMRAAISRLQHDLAVTTVYVTHHQVEALTMAHRVAVQRDGRIVQVGSPSEVYEQPGSLFVAGFVGTPAMNFFNAPIEAGAAEIAGRTIPLPRDAVAAVGGRGLDSLIVGFRPEDLRIVGQGEGWPIRVEHFEDLGAAHIVGEALFPGTDRDVTIRLDGRPENRVRPARGEVLDVVGVQHRMHLFDPETGERLPS